MRGLRQTINQDIGENGGQPMDYAASYWDELRIANAARLARSAQRSDPANRNEQNEPSGSQRQGRRG